MEKFSSFKQYSNYELDELFIKFIEGKDKKLSAIYVNHKTRGEKLDSNDLISVAIYLQSFISIYFDLKSQIDNFFLESQQSKKVFNLKRDFIHRFALQKYGQEITQESENIEKEFFEFTKLDSAELESIDSYYLENVYNKVPSAIPEILTKYAAHRIHSGKKSNLFSKPNRQEFNHLVSFKRVGSEVIVSDNESSDAQEAYYNKNSYQEANYCIKCHHNNRDSCSKGLFKDGRYQENKLGNILKGCPLDIKISEMNELFADGFIISALAVLTLDNPMAALTGHRICNDCSKSCIFQKQQPVDIPLIESEIFRKSLSLDYGFEIYYLLTRWNPLDTQKYPYSTANIMVVGSGPAGIALSYYLLKSGSKVVMIDGLKIEPLPETFKDKTIKNYSIIKELYQNIKPQGFGGVSEYGITDRWNKENLIIIRLILERNNSFQVFGGIKLGSNITYNQALELGFDHIALCCGSGYPKIQTLENIDAGNVRCASDFLMSVGSGDLLNKESKTNFSIDLPAYVVGGGLTAIDTASEIIKYYPILVKKVAGRKVPLANLSAYEQTQYLRFMAVNKLFEEEDKVAKLESRRPNYIRIINSLGGVNIIYRKNIEKSPSYKINHEELDFALKDGIKILENTELLAIKKDHNGNICAIELKLDNTKAYREARTVLFATGTSPLKTDGITPAHAENISIFGDMDPSYSGSVVKAIASAKYGSQEILNKIKTGKKKLKDISKYLIYKIHEANLLADDIIEVKIKNKFIVNNFKPGQFFKLQNFHNSTGSGKAFEPLAITGAVINGDVISLVIQNVGSSSAKAFALKKGDKITLSGPLGTPSGIKYDSSYLLIGGGVGAAALVEYAKILKSKGNKVVFVGGYRKKTHLIYLDELRSFSDSRIFAFDEVIYMESNNSEIFLKGSIIDAIKLIDLEAIENIFVVGSSAMMFAVAEYLSNYKNSKIASINTPMQCMMGGVCGQCLIPIKKNGNTQLIFTCRNQDQILDRDLISSLKIRLGQNSFLEKLSI